LHTPFIKRHNHHLFLGRGARSPSQRTPRNSLATGRQRGWRKPIFATRVCCRY